MILWKITNSPILFHTLSHYAEALAIAKFKFTNVTDSPNFNARQSFPLYGSLYNRLTISPALKVSTVQRFHCTICYSWEHSAVLRVYLNCSGQWFWFISSEVPVWYWRWACVLPTWRDFEFHDQENGPIDQEHDTTRVLMLFRFLITLQWCIQLWCWLSIIIIIILLWNTASSLTGIYHIPSIVVTFIYVCAKFHDPIPAYWAN